MNKYKIQTNIFFDSTIKINIFKIFNILIIIEIQKVKVINRPSKTVKSPYMADIEINNKIELAHSPSLGLCGLIMSGVDVMVSQSINDTRKSKFTIELVQNLNPKKKKVLIGANSLFANKIFARYLDKFAEFENYIIEKPEIKIHNSRLDFLLIDKLENKCYVEVKNVPLIEYENNIVSATFPDGYKTNKQMCISDRAFKHIDELIKLKNEGYRACLIFIIQRDDAEYFKPNYKRDKIYSEKLKEAFDIGVEIYAYKFKWSIKNNIATCKFMKKINVIFN